MLYWESIHTIFTNIGVCCTERTYTQFLQYTTVYFAVNEFTLHNFWFYSEYQRGHLLLFPCTPSFVQYSIWLTIHVTVDTSSTIHSVPSCHTCTLAMCVIFLNNLFKLDFVSSCRLLNYCRGIFSRSDMKIPDFASILRGRLAKGSLHFHTPYVFVVMRHVSRLSA